jgi:hypothetical protein
MKILGLCGKMQSGKNTAANWILGNALVATKTVDWIRINHFGQLVVPAIQDDKLFEGVLDCFAEEAQPLLEACVWPLVKVYSFAEKLKQFAIDVLGLTYDQCHGSNAKKNSMTGLYWENMPGVITNKSLWDDLATITDDKEKLFSYHEPGEMTAREVLQFFGTGVIRRMYSNAWVDATIKQIKKDKPALAIISDVRFINEIEAIQKAGGKVMKLTREPVKSTHISETEIDTYDKYNYVLDNAKLTIVEQNEELTKILNQWKFLPWSMEIDVKQTTRI